MAVRSGCRVRGSVAGLAAALVVVAFPASAGAARMVTWHTDSRFVDPSKAESGYNHPGAPPRPNALRVNVYLPDGYSSRSRRRYPVLFLLHGVGDAFDSWALPGQGRIMDLARGFGGFIVMPEADRGYYTNWWNGGRRGDPAWERYHLDELVPLVERRLPIRRGRRWHAIYGFSMGGMGAMFYASQRPGYFGSAGSSQGTLSLQRPEFQADPTFGALVEQDPDQIFGDPQAERFYWDGHDPRALVPNLSHTRLYVATGNGVPAPDEKPGVGQLTELEVMLQSREFVAAARAAGQTVVYQPQQGTHDWPSRRRHLAYALSRWGLFAPVAEAPGSWDYKTVAQHGEMWGFRFEFVRPPEEVETFALRGRLLRGVGSGTVRIRTPGGCRFTATLPFERMVPPPCITRRRGRRAMRLIVRPRYARVGRRTRFRFRVTTRGSRRPVRRAVIRFARKRVRTNRRGRAAVVLRFRRPGRYRARAKKRGLRSATARVRVFQPRREPRFTG